jgi:hypothetical protein
MSNYLPDRSDNNVDRQVALNATLWSFDLIRSWNKRVGPIHVPHPAREDCMLRQVLVVMFLIIALCSVPATTSCDGDALLVGVVIVGILVLTGAISFSASASASVTGMSEYPPQDFQVLDEPGGTIILECGRGPDTSGHWLKTEVLEPGDVLRVWSESNRGAVAMIFDGEGNPFISENYQSPGVNFRIEMEAVETQEVFLLVNQVPVYGEDSCKDSEPVSIHWSYISSN